MAGSLSFDFDKDWDFITTDFSHNEVAQELDFNSLISDDSVNHSLASSFVEELLGGLQDNICSDSSECSFPENILLESLSSTSWESNASFNSVVTDIASISSEDDGFASLENCSATIKDFLKPDEFNALLESLTKAIPKELSSSGALLDDACHYLSDYSSLNTNQEIPMQSQVNAKQTTVLPENCSHSKPDISYIELVAKAIMSSPNNSVLLADIYRWIEDNYPYYRNTKNSWRNSIRHNLSVNECFVKSRRVKNGRGFYWSIHSSCIEAFKNGDYDRRKARRQVQQCNRAFSSTFQELQHLRGDMLLPRKSISASGVSNNQRQYALDLIPESSSTPQRIAHSAYQPSPFYGDYALQLQ